MNTFSRRDEKKYVLNEKTYQIIKYALSQYMVIDQFGKQRINNIYYDNDFSEVINKSILKPPFKEKLRIRYYGEYDKDIIFYIELKKKYKRIIYKRRAVISHDEMLRLVSKEQRLVSGSSQVVREINYFIEKHNVYPKIYISYDREAFEAEDYPDLRVTFDSNIFFSYDVVNSSETGKYYFNQKLYIMEIKTENKMPLWLKDLLLENKVYPRSFSKYGNIYEKYGEEICL